MMAVEMGEKQSGCKNEKLLFKETEKFSDTINLHTRHWPVLGKVMRLIWDTLILKATKLSV